MQELEDLIFRANQGDAEAQALLGWNYVNGLGVTQDFTEAGKWYKKAAEHGHAGALHSLGVMYTNGKGVPKNLPKAIELIQQAADLGVVDARKTLWTLVKTGVAVKPSGAESMVMDALRVIETILAQEWNLISRLPISDIIEKNVTPVVHHIESNKLIGTRFLPDLLERLAQLYLLSGSYDRQNVINLLERSVQLRYAILGDRHPSILQPLWNLFAQFQQAGINEKANRCFNIANRIVHTDGITAHPNLFMIYNHMNDFVKQATNGAKSFVDVIPFHGNDHVTSRDSMLATYFDDIEFDIYKMYCEKAGNKLNMIEHIIMVPILNVYSLPEAEYFSLSEFVSDNGLQEYVNKSHKITTVPANFYSDNAASPFYEFTIYDVENRRLLLPAVTDSHWKGMPQLAYNETEWFDFIFNDLVFGTNLKMEDII